MARQIQFKTTGGPEVLETVEVEPRAPAAGELQVANRAVGLNFIDIYFRTGLYPADLPGVIGSEGAGVVAAVGAGVDGFDVGDRVAYAQGPRGAYADFMTLPAAHVVGLPDAIEFESAAASLLKGLTVQYLLRQTHAVAAGEAFLFYAAAGGVGLLACQWAAALGARLIGVVSSADKARLAREHGAWATIDYSRESVPERVRALTDGACVAVVYDSVGRDTWADSLACLARRGLMVSFGNASGPVEGINLVELNRGGSLFVTRPKLGDYADTRARLEAMAAELFEMIASGQLKARIGARYELGEAGQAQRALADRATTGATILLP